MEEWANEASHRNLDIVETLKYPKWQKRLDRRVAHLHWASIKAELVAATRSIGVVFSD